MRDNDLSAGVRTAVPVGTVMRAALLGGLAFVLFKMAMAHVLGGDVFAPLYFIGAMVLGERSLSGSSSLALIITIALTVHLALSLLYAAVFTALLSVASPLRRSPTIVLAAGSAMGLVLWVMNLYLFAPLLFPWFVEHHRPLVEVAARVLFFGLPVGLVVARALPPQGSSGPRTAPPASAPGEDLVVDPPTVADNDSGGEGCYGS